MTKTTSILFFCFFLTSCLSAQRGTHISVDYSLRLQAEDEIRIPHEAKDNPHLSYFVEASPLDMANMQWRFSSTAPWAPIALDDHLSYEESYFSKLQFSEQGQIDTLYLRSVGELRGGVFYHRYYPGSSSPLEYQEADLREEDCDCPQPDIQERAEWCSNCPTTQTPVKNEPTHLIVHHSAGPNSSSDWAAVVRSIWDFHVNGRGWADIGYHYLIDPNGEIYLGRADDIQGAHFCAQNQDAMGMCVLGTFTNVSPASAARVSWVDLAAYAACKWEVSPQSRSIHASSGLDLLGVSGHRDGCATACPGQELYGQLNEWRSDLRSRMDGCSAGGQDTLILEAVDSPFPYTVDLNWSGGIDELTEYRLKVREVNSGIFGNRQLSFPEDKTRHRLGLRAGEDYEFTIEAWNESGKLQTSNTVSWSTAEWALESATMSLSPNPLVGNQAEWIWTDTYRGEVELAWINMAGQVYPLGSWLKSSDSFLLTLSRTPLPAGRYLLRVTYDDQEVYLPLIML